LLHSVYGVGTEDAGRAGQGATEPNDPGNEGDRGSCLSWLA
jgi:hypothetical protein